MINKIIMLIFLSLHLISCAKEENNNETSLLAVKLQKELNSLFYSGTIQPIKTMVVTSPADGVIVEMSHQYGENVMAGDLLFRIASTKFLSDYKTALMQYVKSKNEFNTAKTQLSESNFLHQNGLISDDDYKTKKSNYYASQLSLVQARDTLENLLLQLDVKNIDLYKLTIADIDKITKAMHLQMATESLRVLSAASGILLASPKNDDTSKKLLKGDIVKEGDVLAIIGDMSGLHVQIKVNELTINQLKPGDPVKVTGLAFAEHQLMGVIKQVDRQGEANMSGLPTFSVRVEVPHLTSAQQKMIHVGMSAKVEIDVQELPKIHIPLNAITEKNGKFYVKRFDEIRKKITEVMIKPGKTTLDSVSVLSGLKPGDKIVIPH